MSICENYLLTIMQGKILCTDKQMSLGNVVYISKKGARIILIVTTTEHHLEGLQ